MKTYTNLWKDVCSFENLYRAWKKARRGKTGKAAVVRFESELEENLLRLQDELQSETIKEDIEKGEFYIAYANQKTAGVFKFQKEDRMFWPDIPEGESTYIHRLAVKRKFSGGKISSAMINYAKMKTKEMGRQFLRLDCDVSRPKLHILYKKHGFMEHSNRQVGPYYVTRYQFEITT